MGVGLVCVGGCVGVGDGVFARLVFFSRNVWDGCSTAISRPIETKKTFL